MVASATVGYHEHFPRDERHALRENGDADAMRRQVREMSRSQPVRSFSFPPPGKRPTILIRSSYVLHRRFRLRLSHSLCLLSSRQVSDPFLLRRLFHENTTRACGCIDCSPARGSCAGGCATISTTRHSPALRRCRSCSARQSESRRCGRRRLAGKVRYHGAHDRYPFSSESKGYGHQHETGYDTRNFVEGSWWYRESPA